MTTEPNPKCTNHNWIDATNEKVSGTDYCDKCGALRSHQEPDSIEQEFEREFSNVGWLPENKQRILAFIKRVQQRERDRACEVVSTHSEKLNKKQPCNCGLCHDHFKELINQMKSL